MRMSKNDRILITYDAKDSRFDIDFVEYGRRMEWLGGTRYKTIWADRYTTLCGPTK